MRSDASALLQKLNRQGLNYHQFPDAYADLELWPIFEALLNDERVVERRLSRVQQRESEFAAALGQGQQAEPVSLPKGHPLEQHFSTLLSAYGPQGTEGGAEVTEEAGAPKADLRTFLNQLGGRGE